ncbi:MAG TPA: AMP-binding protein, partial [Candidatus Competibacteraceae bacterium]|nr:AMP-binding protein [Candidatus Competibacteraceae bacterium]
QPLEALAELPFQFSNRTQPWEAPRDERGQLQPRVAAINSFAYGGVNAHLVLREAPPLPRTPLPERERLLVFSAADATRLRQTVATLHEFLGEESLPPFPDIAHTLQIGRETYRYRLTVLARHYEEARTRLGQWLAGETHIAGVWSGEAVQMSLRAFGQEPEDRDYLAALWRAGKLESIAALWLQGAPIPWMELNQGEKYRRASLPPTPWATTRFWIDSSPGPALPVELANDEALSSREFQPPQPPQPPAPSLLNPTGEPSASPDLATPILETVRAVLGLSDQPGLTERSLPDLGVDSLQAQELRGVLVRTLAIDAPLSMLLTAASLGELARQLATMTKTHPPLAASLPWISDHAQRFAPFPLTDIQFSYLLGRGDRHALGGQGCHLYWEFERDHWDVDRLEQSWNRLIARHDMLRAIFSLEGRQQILPEVPLYRLEIRDWQARSEAEALAQWAAWRAQCSHECFAVDRWPLFRIGVARLPGRMRLLLSIDLLLVDGMSLFLLLKEWAQGYEGAPSGEDPPLFRDYVQSLIAHQHSESWRQSLTYWQERLETLPPAPELPLSADPALLRQSLYRRLEYRLAKPQWDRLGEQARQRGLTPVAVLATAFAETLARWATQPRFTLNLTVAQRLPLHPRIAETVGDFTSNLLLVTDFSVREPFAARAARLGQQLLHDLEHAQVSGARVLGELTRHRRQPVLMPVVFTSLLGYEVTGQTLDVEVLGRFIGGVTQTPQVWLDAQAMMVREGLYLSWDAVEALFAGPLLDAMFAAFTERVTELAEYPASWERASSLLPAAQRARRQAVNATEIPFPPTLLHAAFCNQARRAPERPAVIAADRQLRYGELAQRAAALARELQQQGVQRNQLVAVVMNKGWEQVVAVLAILQAGAAYLPIEASQPARRIHELLELGKVRLALSQQRLKARLEWPAHVTVRWVDETCPVATLPIEQGPATPDDLAYVIFTSGSTGVPKGVMIRHHAAANTVHDINRRFAITAEDRILALSALSFDLSVYDLFGPLSVGGALVLPKPALLRDPQGLAQQITRERVTLWNSVPSYLQLLAEALNENDLSLLASLRLALLSGDWIPLSLPARVRTLAPQLRLISLGGATEAA